MTDKDKVMSSSLMYLSGQNYTNDIFFPTTKSTHAALLDFRANHNIIHPTLAAIFLKQKFQLSQPITFSIADGSMHKSGYITHAVNTLCHVENDWS